MTQIKNKPGRKTKEERIVAYREKFIPKTIAENKFLRDAKYYKGNYWSWAAWDSWAAQGKAGSCPCGCGYYNGTLKNKRAATGRGGRQDTGKKWPIDISYKLCWHCVQLIHKIIGVEFPKH